MALSVAACAETAPVASNAAHGVVTSVGTDPDAAVETLARGLALALNEPGLRRQLKERFRESRLIEHKVLLHELVTGSRPADRALLTRIGDKVDMTPAQLRSMLSSFRELEIYLPVRRHRDRWTGSELPIVVVAIDDDALPVSFNTSGVRSVLSRDSAPTAPAIVLTSREARATDSVPQHVSARRTAQVDELAVSGYCEPTMAPTAAQALSGAAAPLIVTCEELPPPYVPPPAWPQLGPVPTAREGLWMQAMKIYNNREPWYRGDPEIEFQVERWRPNTLEHQPNIWDTAWLNPTPKPTPIACSGRLSADPLRAFEFNGEGGATYIQNVLLWDPVRDTRQETVRSFVDDRILATRRTPLQFPLTVILTERDDGAECPKPTVEGLSAGFSISVGATFSLDGDFKKWDAKPKLKDLLVALGVDNANDEMGRWSFNTFTQLQALNRTKFEGWADVYLTNNFHPLYFGW